MRQEGSQDVDARSRYTANVAFYAYHYFIGKTAILIFAALYILLIAYLLPFCLIFHYHVRIKTP